jgi:hypothetical protein
MMYKGRARIDIQVRSCSEETLETDRSTIDPALITSESLSHMPETCSIGYVFARKPPLDMSLPTLGSPHFT